MREEKAKKAKKSFGGKFNFFQKKIQRDKKNKKTSQKGRSKIKSLYP